MVEALFEATIAVLSAFLMLHSRLFESIVLYVQFSSRNRYPRYQVLKCSNYAFLSLLLETLLRLKVARL